MSPLSHTASVTTERTVPAVCTIARRRGIRASAAASTAGEPQPVTSTSTSASSSSGATERSGTVRETSMPVISARRSRWAGENILSCSPAGIASSVLIGRAPRRR